MSLFKIGDLRSEFNSKYFNESKSFESKDNYARRILNEQIFNRYKTYDIFLSHSIRDADLILELKRLIESLGFSVYVDWIDDAQLNRSSVNVETAKTIRERIRASKSLLYALTSNSIVSSWVQWELGFADGEKNGRVAILPLIDVGEEGKNFYRQEYLGLYPYIDRTDSIMWVNGKKYIKLREWLNSTEPLEALMYS